MQVGGFLKRVAFCVYTSLSRLLGVLTGLQGAPSCGHVFSGGADTSVAKVWRWGRHRQAGFSQLIASGFAMAVGRATLRCGLIWIHMGSGDIWNGSILGWVRLSGRVLIGALDGGVVNSELAMGQAGTGPSFCIFGVSRISMAAAQEDCAPGLLYSGFVVVAGLDWAVGREVIDVKLAMGAGREGPGFS